MAEERPTYSDDFKRNAVETALRDMSPFPQIEESFGIRRGLLMQWMLQIDLCDGDSNAGLEELRKMRLEIEEIRLESELLSTMAGLTVKRQSPQTNV